MNGFKDRFYKDFHRFQTAIEKEGQDLLNRVKGLDLKGNLETQKKQFAKTIEKKIKTFEPMCFKFLDEIKKNAKKAGLDLSKVEDAIKKVKKNQPKKAASVKKTVAKPAPKKVPPRRPTKPRTKKDL